MIDLFIQELIDWKESHPRTKGQIRDKELHERVLADPRFPEIMKSNEKAAALILGEHPVCAKCGAEVKFYGTKKEQTVYGGFNQYCSQQCMRTHDLTHEKRRNTSIERFGVPHYMNTQEAKEKFAEPWSSEKKKQFVERATKKFQENYGVAWGVQAEAVKEKQRETILRNSDGKYTNSFQDVERIRASNMEKYGVPSWKQTPEGRACSVLNNPMKNPEIQMKSRWTRMTNRYTYTKNASQIRLGEILMNNQDDAFKPFIDSIAAKNGFVSRKEIAKHINVSYPFLNALFRRFGMGNDYITLGTGYSYEEEDVFQFICSIIDPSRIKRADRTILNGKEIDFLIDGKIGIEYNGTYFHSEQSGGKDAKYHVNKTDLAESKGIQLLQIISTEWKDPIQCEIWKSIIRAKIGLITNTRHARKCSIVDVKPADARSFYEKNHLSGFIGAMNHYGLHDGFEVVSMISVGKNRFSKESVIEIYRFASLLNMNVHGGFGKLFAHVIKNHGTNIMTFADRRVSGQSSVYSKFFMKQEKVGAGWSIVENHEYLHHRLSFTKKKIQTLLQDSYDETKTALENLFDDKRYDRIFDCGSWRYSILK